MTLSRRTLLTATAALATPAISRAQTAAIRIGEINSYTAVPSFTLPYRNGWTLAVEQINAAGGVLGRKLEVLSRDDAGKPQDAVEIVAKRFDLREGEQDNVLTHLAKGGDLSLWGLANAVTRSAEDCESYDRAIELERVGGMVVELPQNLFNN